MKSISKKSKTEITGRLWLSKGNKHFLGKGRIELLEKIKEFNSITKAAKAMKMSYKAAWDAVNEMNNLSDEPLVESISGGSGGGGSRLTERGKTFLKLFKEIESKHLAFIRQLSENIKDYSLLQPLLKGFYMKTSARNQLFGKVVKIKKGAVNSEVVMNLRGKDSVTAIITNESLKNLSLQIGCEVFALIKASMIMLSPGDENLKISARNKLHGIIESVITGKVNDEVTVKLSGGNTITSIITKESSKELGIKKGVKVYAIFKASSVILAVN